MSTRYIKREIEKHGYLVKNVKSIELMSNSSGVMNRETPIPSFFIDLELNCKLKLQIKTANLSKKLQIKIFKYNAGEQNLSNKINALLF